MKPTCLFIALMAAGALRVAARPLPSPSTVRAEKASVVANPANPLQPRPKRERTTFRGTIQQTAWGSYVLHDTRTNTEFQLDDPRQAKSFAGKSVKVTGTLNPAQTLIHVIEIEAL